MQNEAVAQDLVHLHSNVRHILGNGLDPLNEASPRGEPRGEGRARGEPMSSGLGQSAEATAEISRGGVELASVNAHLAHSRKVHLRSAEYVRHCTWD